MYCPIVMYGTPRTLSIICITPLTVPMSDSTTLALIPLAQTLISLVKEKRELRNQTRLSANAAGVEYAYE